MEDWATQTEYFSFLPTVSGYLHNYKENYNFGVAVKWKCVEVIGTNVISLVALW